MASNTTINLKNLPSNNATHVARFHPKHRNQFSNFLQACQNEGIPIWIYSSLRSFATQEKLYSDYKSGRSSIPAASAGKSRHNYGLAFDGYIIDLSTNSITNDRSKYKRAGVIAAKFGLRWLGLTISKEYHHYDYNGYDSNSLFNLFKNRLIDKNGFVLLDNIDDVKDRVITMKNKKYVTTLNSDSVSFEEVQVDKEETKIKKFNLVTQKTKANGIWQIIKLVADQYSLSQNINDATIAHNQGSLFSFVQNVIQEPWLQFFGDTIDNKYYFFARKEPFDYNGFSKLPVNDTIKVEDVLTEELSWYDGPVYSWYQIIPRGSFVGEQNLIFAYVTAVFFEEYADIWGSKPNVQVSNYINFVKTDNKAVLFDKAKEDLRYMVESNAYLPFTRHGTITIKGKTNLKRGYKLRYLPTKEIFYVSSISHRMTMTENGNEYITIIKVERGMKIDYFISPKDSSTNSYFNLILFDDEKPKADKPKIIEVPSSSGKLNVFFDNNRTWLIDLSEKFKNFGEDLKMVRTIEKLPNLRSSLSESNERVIKSIADLIENNPKANKFICKGYVDSDNLFISKRLPLKRAKTLKSLVIADYVSRYKKFSKDELETKIETIADFLGKTYTTNSVGEDFKIDKETNFEEPLKTLAYSRYASFTMPAYKYETTEKDESKGDGMGWRVNRKVFQFFLNRKQNG